MVFTRRLREGVRKGTITCTVRIWTHPHVKVGGRYRMDEGEIEVDSIREITLADITPDLARRSGFTDVADLLGIAKHGRGEHIYLIRFRYSASFLPRRAKARRSYFPADRQDVMAALLKVPPPPSDKSTRKVKRKAAKKR